VNDETTNLDQADEDVLNTPTVSDEAIEAAVYGCAFAWTEGCLPPPVTFDINCGGRRRNPHLHGFRRGD
jgi:hypothetical protein